MLNNNPENNISNIENNKKTIIIVVSIIVIILLSLFFVFNNFKKDDTNNNNEKTTENQQENKKENQKEDNKENTSDKEDPNKEIIWTNKKNEPDTLYEVYLKDNKLYVNNSLVDKNIKKYFDVSLGGDICEGNRYIIVLKEDKTIGALSIDNLTCGDKVTYQEKINNLENVTDVYSRTKDLATPYEPAFYNIYVDTETEEKILINEYLK